MAGWFIKNRETIYDRQAKWRAANGDKWRLYGHKRRMKKRVGSVTTERPAQLMKLQREKCAICKVSLRESGYHIDHIIPLALDGPHQDDNIQLLCPTCNVRKSDKDPINYMRECGMLL